METARRYRAIDCYRVPVDDFWDATNLGVEIDGTAVDLDTVDMRPWNGVVNGQPGWPFMDLFRINTTWPYKRRATIEVTAAWGWAAVPEGIKQATLNVAAAVASGGDSGGPVKSEAIDGYSVSYALSSGDMVTSLVALSTFSLAEPYRRKLFGVA